MKFTLSETKFILQENKQFLLDERFILTEAETLTEASAEAVAQSWTQKFKTTFDNTKAVLKKYIEFAGLANTAAAQQTQFKKLKADLEASTQELENTMELPIEELIADSFNTAKAELKRYTDVLIQIQKTVKPTTDTADTFTLLAARLKSLNVLRTRFGQWKPQDSEAVKQILNWVTEKVAPTFDTASLDTETANIEAFKQTCNECLKLLEKLQPILPKKAEDFSGIQSTDLKTYCNILKQLIETIKLPEAGKLNKGLIVANIKKYQTQVQNLKDSYTQLLNSAILKHQATKAKIDVENAETTAEMSASRGQKDWKSKFAGAVNKNTVIQEFIYTTWPKAATEVLKIKDSLLSECEAYGFDTEGEHQNPFLSFISNVYLKYKELLTLEKYNTIHNLTADKYLTKKDLIGEGDMGLGNLIFCKSLYALDPGVIKLYIKKQFNLLKAVNKTTSFQTNAEMAFNALYSLTEITKGDKTKNSADMSLRSIADIERLEAKWTGQVSDTAEEDNNKKKVVINDELLQQINTSENAIKVLVALAVKFSSNDKIVAAVQTCKEAREVMAKTTTLEDIRKLVASVERLYKIEAITAMQALNLTKNILESDQFNLTTE